MQQLIRFTEKPRTCSYLPSARASLEFRAITDMTADEYADLLARGYRRFGWQVFRPACPACRACRSLRVLTQQFTPSGSERRILRKNAGIRVELAPLTATPEIVDLYNTYHRFMETHRGWPQQSTALNAYRESFLSGAVQHGRQWRYFDHDRLVGIAVMDEVPGAVSLVYCFYHPDWRADSPGTFSILTQLEYARAQGYQYAYFGYWIEQCQSMQYKGRFRPHQILREYPRDGQAPVWE